MHLAPRIGAVGTSATVEVARRADELRRQGVDLLDLSVGEPDFPSPPAAVEAARRALAAGKTRYAQVAGLPELRQALAQRYRRRWDAPWEAASAVVTVGGKAALLELALALVGEGDQVVIPTPCWPTFPAQVRLAGGEPVTVATDPADGFRLHAAPLLAAVGERTRAVLINAPTNPTGGLITAGELETLAAGCAERGVVLIADESYELFVWDGEPVSAAALARRFPETVVVVGTFSKTWAMTGWRLGWLLAPPPLAAAVTAVQSHATTGPTTFAMHGALAVLEGPTAAEVEAAVEAQLADYAERRRLVAAGLAAIPGLRCAPPGGAFYAFPDVSAAFARERRGSVAFARWLLDEARIAVVPGAAFGADDHVRLSFACSRSTLETALTRLGDLLAAAPGGL